MSHFIIFFKCAEFHNLKFLNQIIYKIIIRWMNSVSVDLNQLIYNYNKNLLISNVIKKS